MNEQTVIVGLEFNDQTVDVTSVLNQLNENVDSILGKTENVNVIAVSKERLGTLASDDTDTILQGTVAKYGEVKFDVDNNEVLW